MKTERETFRAAVFMIVRDNQGKVLLQRRVNTGFMDGYYDFPSGHVDAGESFAESAVRELREETSLKTTEADLEVLQINQNYLDYQYINIIFTVRQWSGVPSIVEADKCDDQQFFALDDLPRKCTLAVRCIERDGWTGGPHLSRIIPADFEALIGVRTGDL